MKNFLALLLFQTLCCCTKHLHTCSWQYKSKRMVSGCKAWLVCGGPFSIPGDGEWVMNNRNITVKNYSRLMDFLIPLIFWPRAAMGANGERCGYEIYHLITRHHDGFSMWDSKSSTFNIMNSGFIRKT